MAVEVIHRRRSLRLRGYDYRRRGAYFVTACAEDRRRVFGTVVNGRMALNDAGRMIQTVWDELPDHYPGVVTDAFVVMPDHVHGVVWLAGQGGGQARGPARTAEYGAGSVAGSGSAVGAGPRACPLSSAVGAGSAVGSGSAVGAGPRACPSFKSGGGQARGPAPTISLPDVVHRFKSLTTHRYIDGVTNHGWPRFPGRLWQRNYYEIIVRDASALTNIRAYIRNNPAHWDVAHYGAPRFMMGNPALLDMPMTAFLASRGPYAACRAPDAPCIISGFLSPMERSVFDACLAAGTPMVHVLATSLPTTLSQRVRTAIDAGRLLIITPFAAAETQCSASRAAWCNQYVLHTAQSVVIGQLATDGMLACLLADLPDEKPVVVLQG